MSAYIRPEIALLAQEVDDYLRSYPDAADSIEGIVNWWLLRQRHEQTRELVQQALEHLVAQGLVNKIATPGGEVIYARCTSPMSGGAER